MHPIVEQVKRFFECESEALKAVGKRVGDEIVEVVKIILACEGRVIVIGIGKAGIVGRKIAATLASTGIPAFFLHPAEALHGDLGVVTPRDVIVALSKSGCTEEITDLLPYFRRIGVRIISITGNPRSALAQSSDVVLDVSVDREADPLGIVPTTSAVAMMAMGDALVAALITERGFNSTDFAQFHPGGSLGKKLLLRVADLMHTGDQNPVIDQHRTVREAILEMTSKGLGATSIVDASGRLVGILTDGDLRRLFQRVENPLDLPVHQVMTKTPKWVPGDMLGTQAIQKMEAHAITVLPVLDAEHRPCGMVHLHDLVKAGLL